MGKQGNRLPIYLRCSLENGRSTGSTDSRPSSRMDGANGSPIYLRCSLENGRSTAKMAHRSDSRDTLLAALPLGFETKTLCPCLNSTFFRRNGGGGPLG